MFVGLSLAVLWPIVLLAAFIGAAAGSFAAVVVARHGSGESCLTGRSHCVCGVAIPMWWNIPVLSYLLLRGRSRCCDASIPRWYLLFELAAGTAFALATAAFALWAIPLCVVALVVVAWLVARAEPSFAH